MQSVHEGTTASHGQSCNGPVAFLSFYPVGFFNMWHKFIEEEIFIVPVAFWIIEVPAPSCIGIRHNNDHWSRFTFLDRLVGNVKHFTKLYPSRLIVATTMQQVEDGVAPL